MNISIIIPAYNEERLLPSTLHAIQKAANAFTSRGWSFETIVSDNNSTDRTAEIARAAGAKVVFEPINQIARARNRGAEVATGTWLLFIDADSQPSEKLFSLVADTINSGTALAGGSTVKLEDGYPIGQGVTQLWNLLSRWKKWVAGSFIFCEASAFREVGGFNTELFVTEELDLSKRLLGLAKQRRKKMVILTHAPLLTSARKMHLYTRREHMAFLWRSLLSGGKSFNSREACQPWYDGRR